MARVTVEDCLGKVGNRFELVLLAARRARQLAMGRDALVEWENDKPTVVALREIAEGKITEELLSELEKAHEETEEFSFEHFGEEIPAAPAAPAEPTEQPQAGAEPGAQPEAGPAETGD